MERRKKPKHKQNHERWLVTYSDLITLLLVFFVVMFAMSTIDKTRFATLAESLYQALHPGQQIPLNMGTTALLESGDQNNGQQFPDNLQNPNNPSNATTQNQQSNEDLTDAKQLDLLYREIQQYIASHHLSGEVQVIDEARGVQITMRDVALFNTGQAVLLPKAKAIIEGLIPFFKQISNDIVVEGYTDTQPINTPIYPSNWELSAARAMSVVRFLADHGINPTRLAGMGYGQYHPVASNATPAGRQANRRVNIVILRKIYAPGTAPALPTN
ncbi:flagellar motor protein MotB [Alicyclobacillus acidocaldarius]|uniref:OmpA/MotB domain protein n=1 Tax=Alicyclobacillus acidocaldarius subsp. acidocaldarius (strain ATCC 27009 / DSM 446 / BCRC 14685 / JCM 5260 / KCTC 1825 / NBRC 15652 / NCIMB 11725 / NRRL B-14509 / 104-IA) TaxID=521098 RepID=C8WS34_ALIAD|nr:flagellar motor protein MotB [Alicyclobacillus acidocaldarius]ACV57468.1 OmpA/MotB domain protein [Alicyclobacillus acidocaldarius subsp. acidocaldarius DSM 446]